jgi:hypothetical protein
MAVVAEINALFRRKRARRLLETVPREAHIGRMSEYKSGGGYAVVPQPDGTFEVTKRGTPVRGGFRTAEEAWEWIDQEDNADSPE